MFYEINRCIEESKAIIDLSQVFVVKKSKGFNLLEIQSVGGYACKEGEVFFFKYENRELMDSEYEEIKSLLLKI